MHVTTQRRPPGEQVLAPSADEAPSILMASRGTSRRTPGRRESRWSGNGPTPDLVHVPSGCIVEVDEVQHFTTARRDALALYPPGVGLGFDLAEYRQLIDTWHPKADRAYAHRMSADFPFAGGRRDQRAYKRRSPRPSRANLHRLSRDLCPRPQPGPRRRHRWPHRCPTCVMTGLNDVGRPRACRIGVR